MRRRVLALELLPFAVGLLALLWDAFSSDYMALELLYPVIALELIAPLVLIAVAGARRDRSLLRHLWRIPALLAPLAVVYPWALIPTRLGMGFGGLPTFLGWLTRYPSLGPFNGPVLAGLGCVLGAGAMPALHALAARRVGPRALTAIFLLALVPVVPVWIRLDWELCVGAWIGLPSLFQAELLAVPLLAFGPLMRALAVLGMAVGTVSAWLGVGVRQTI